MLLLSVVFVALLLGSLVDAHDSWRKEWIVGEPRLVPPIDSSQHARIWVHHAIDL
jgi:hypothetical protein